MAEVIGLAEMKQHLNVVDDADDALIARKIDAATAHVAQAASVDFDALGEDAPEDLREAVRMLAAHLYENREASIVGVSASTLPFGFDDLIRPYRKEWF